MSTQSEPLKPKTNKRAVFSLLFTLYVQFAHSDDWVVIKKLLERNTEVTAKRLWKEEPEL